MIRRPPRSTPFPTRRSSDLIQKACLRPRDSLPLLRGSARAHHAQSLAGAEDRKEHTSELQSRLHLVCRLLLEKKKNIIYTLHICLTHHIVIATALHSLYTLL